MNAHVQQPPPYVPPRVTSAPSIRQLYWCDFPQDAQLPEFWKRRPVVIVSFKNTLHGAVTVVPCSTQAQPGNKWAFPLQTTIDGRAAFAICDKITTVAVSRLLPDKGGIARMPVPEFDDMLRLVLKWLPVPSAPVTQGEAPPPAA
ncbi:type II toxin-antitoxin system PemK/MazF family toxin [Sphingomonas abaci]|uniref:mRNA interferase MazF n=1 Tax=Sphingomonas abaci TaxID=237611 RepID=A0A7W7EZM4_9SPHN|nr:mRNA interferase MazF [Sphingomonas abaci]